MRYPFQNFTGGCEAYRIGEFSVVLNADARKWYVTVKRSGWGNGWRAEGGTWGDPLLKQTAAAIVAAERLLDCLRPELLETEK